MTGKVVVVTGAASGIGRACADRFVLQGASVVLADQSDTGELAESIRSQGGQALSVRVDVSDELSVSQLFVETDQTFGHVDIVVNAAGLHHRGLSYDVPLSEWDKVIDTNLKGTFLCCRSAIQRMRLNGAGVIINVGSELAYVAAPHVSVYSASKAGVVHLTRCLARDHGVDGIRVNCVCPGPTDTPLLQRSFSQSDDPAGTRRGVQESTIMGRFGRPEEIANVVHFLASDEASYMTGSIVLADGGVTSKAP